MADAAGELRHAIEATVNQQIEAQAAQRGWDLGAAAFAAQNSATGANVEADTAVVFATGYDSGTGLTTMGFTFDASLFNGPDLLL